MQLRPAMPRPRRPFERGLRLVGSALVAIGITAVAGACPDTDGNGVIDVDDAISVLLDWGTDGSANNGDVDGSGHVNVYDLVAVFVALGPASPPCATVPADVLHLDIWYGGGQSFGLPGRPQRQVNVLGNVHALHGLESLTYSVDGGAEHDLSVGPDHRRLADPGDFNVELFYDGLPLGSSEVLVRAVDLLGNELVETVTVDVPPPAAWPLPYAVDWSGTGDLHEAVDVTDGRWELSPDGLHCTVPDYDRLVVLGDATWQDYQMTVPVTVHAVDPAGYEWPSLVPAVGVVFRWKGHTDLFNRGAQPNQGWWPLGAAFEHVFRQSGCGRRFEIYGNPFSLLDEEEACSMRMELDETWIWKMKVRTTGSGHRYKFKAWRQGEPEPNDWLFNVLEPLHEPGFGSIGLLAHHVEVTFGDITVVPVGD